MGIFVFRCCNVLTYDLSTKIVGFRLKSKLDHSGGGDPDDDDDRNIDIDFESHTTEGLIGYKQSYFCENICDDGYTSQRLFRGYDGYINLYVYPSDVQIVSTGNTFLPSVDKVRIEAPTGYTTDTYKWVYYSESDGTWKQFYNTSLLGQNVIDISAEDIYGPNYIDSITNLTNTSIALEFLVYDETDGPESKGHSNMLTLVNMLSAPHISSHTTTTTKCFDSIDGSITLNFDRKLYSGETLEALLKVGETAYRNVTVNSSDSILTIEDLPAATYTLNLLGTYNGSATYTDASNQTVTFTITKPDAVAFSVSDSSNINCYNGSDGSISLSATGGQGAYLYSLDDGDSWKDFSNGASTTISNLSAGTYNIKVCDTNDCVAKDDGNEKVVSVTLTQPASALSMPENEIVVTQPTGYGLSNGWISVLITGGTPNDDGSYNFEWKDENGTVITSGITTDAVNNPFTLKLDNLTAGKYFLTVKDKNYAAAETNNDSIQNCGILAEQFVVDQPQPLTVSISLEKCISCNIANDYQYKSDANGNNVPDEAEDAIIKANVTGGVAPYTFQWQEDGTNLSGETDSLLEDVTEGTYKILITDKNNNTTSAELYIPYPEQLTMQLSANTISCNSENEGWVKAEVSGGRGTYTYQWSTLDTIAKVEDLPAGSYFVLVKDSAGCSIQGNVSIDQPDGLSIEDVAVENPLCYDAANGAVSITVSGGKTPYTIAWDNGMSGENISGLKAGKYIVTLTDANGCSMSKEYTLTNPEKLTLNLGDDVTLCSGDSLLLNIAIDDAGASYEWTNADGTVISNSPTVTLFDADTYTGIVTTSDGCIATDDIVIKNSSAVLSPEFLVTTHAYTDESVILVNTSTVEPEKVEWVVPENDAIQTVSETDQSIELLFSETGTYSIGLRGIQGECDKTVYKDIVVEDNIYGVTETQDSVTNIKTFTVSPNPNQGEYTVTVELLKAASIRLRIMALNSVVPYSPVEVASAESFSVPFNYNLPSGVYLIILETGTESRVKKMIVN